MDERLRASLEVYDRQGYELLLLTPDGYALLRRADETLFLQADGRRVPLPPLAVAASGAVAAAPPAAVDGAAGEGTAGGGRAGPRRWLVLALALLAAAALSAAFLLGLAFGSPDPVAAPTPDPAPTATTTPTVAPTATPEVTPTPPPEPTPVATPPPARTGEITSGEVPTEGFGLIVFGGGTDEELVEASGCPWEAVAFWTTNVEGEMVPFIPAGPAFVNEEWEALFPTSIPPDTPLLARCG